MSYNKFLKKKVFVKLSDGSKFVDRLINMSSGSLVFHENGHIRNSRIKTISIYRGDPEFIFMTTRRCGWVPLDHYSANKNPEKCPAVIVLPRPPTPDPFTLAILKAAKKYVEPPQTAICAKILSPDGCCPIHDKVRWTGAEIAEERKERIEPDEKGIRRSKYGVKKRFPKGFDKK